MPLSVVGIGQAAAVPPHHAQAVAENRPVIESHVKDIITVDGQQFRDLDDNGRLDPYEDWRLSAAQRAADLVSRMTLE